VAKKTVVYVEDNPANFALVRRLLESTGNYEVTGAEDGAEGLALVQSEHPDLVLLDLDLPTMHGLQILHALKHDEATAKLPVIVISASVMQKERSKTLDAGAEAFVEKPFDILEFRTLVDKTCGLE
jgi:CheY-like chemotaxis protein